MHQIRFRPRFRPGPRWGVHDAPPDPLVGWGRGTPLPIPYSPRRVRHLGLVAFGASFPKPPPKIFSGYGPGFAARTLKRIYVTPAQSPLRVRSMHALRMSAHRSTPGRNAAPTSRSSAPWSALQGCKKKLICFTLLMPDTKLN